MSQSLLTTAPNRTALTIKSPRQASAVAGFTLIELMIAITLGLLLLLGLITLFGATSKTNRVQDGMAQLQENGRYAMSRMNADLRMVGHQTLNISGFVSTNFDSTVTPNGVVNPTIAADVYVATIKFPDFDKNGLSAPSTATGWSANWPASTAWPLSQRYFLQGYECSVGTCTPALPTGTTNDLPTAGLAATKRIKTADVLTLRYINAPGWSLIQNELTETTSGAGNSCAGDSLATLTLTPATGSPASNFVTGDLAMLVVGSRAEIFQVNVSGTAPSATLTPSGLIAGTSLPCFTTSPAGTDAVLYNFSRDFLTVTYSLKLDTDPNDSTRLIPALVRRQSTIASAASATPAAGTDQELVQGVEQMDFLYGVERMVNPATPPATPQPRDSAVSYMTGDLISGQSSYNNCPPEPHQYTDQMPAGTAEPECLWRATRSIEAHILVDSVNNMYDLSPADMAYQYPYGYSGTDQRQTPAPPTAAPASGLAPGNMMRREFVSMISIRNYNP